MSVTAGIAAVKASLDIAKLVSDRLNHPDIDPPEIRAKMHELLMHMVNAQVALGEAQIEITELRKKLDDRNRIEEFGKNFTFEEGVYWHRNYPYCPNCWDSDRKPTRLDGPYATRSNTRVSWKCAHHNSTYYLNVKK